MKKTPYSDPTMAGVYSRVAAPLQFAPPAKDLVRTLQLERGDIVLDVGTGTGAVAREAMEALGSGAFVVGVDAAIQMLGFARKTAAYPVVVGQIPELPYRDRTFDVVMASFVITHFTDYGRGLSEMVRVCRIGGRIGITAWGSLPNPGAQLWSDIASQFVPRKHLDDAFRGHIPWDGWFSQPTNVRHALEDAGLVSVTIHTRQYQVRMATTDFLIAREASVQGMVLRQELNDDSWDEFRQRVADAFRHGFDDTIEYDRDVHFGIGLTSAAR